MDIIYTARKRAYLLPALLLLIAFSINLLVLGIIRRLPDLAFSKIVILLVVLSGLVLLLSFKAFSLARQTHIRVTPTQLEITLSAVTTTILWREIQAYRQTEWQLVLFMTDKNLVIPVDKFLDETNLVKAIDAYIPSSALTQEAIEKAYPVAKTYRELLENKKIERTITVLWLYILHRMAILSVSIFLFLSYQQFVISFSLFLLLCLAWVRWHPRYIKINNYGATAKYWYNSKQISWQEVHTIERSNTSLIFIGDNNRLSIPSDNYWNVAKPTKKEILEYLHAYIWQQKIRIRWN